MIRALIRHVVAVPVALLVLILFVLGTGNRGHHSSFTTAGRIGQPDPERGWDMGFD